MKQKTQRKAAAKGKPAPLKTIDNRRARFDYEIKDVYQAGIVLSGAETKSLRMHHGQLRGAFVTIKDGEAWLLGASIMPMQSNAAHMDESTQTRTRKLLLSRKEITLLEDAKNQGFTIVPLRILTGKRYIKVEIATARGKRQYDKRETLKKRDIERNLARY